MDGNFKKIALVFIYSILVSCNKNEKTNTSVKDSKSIEQNLIVEGRKFIKQNSNIIIDSIASFDLRFMNPKVKEEKLTIGLIDSIYYKNIGNGSDKNFISFKLNKDDLADFKSEYQLNLIQKNNKNSTVLYITLSNFRIENNVAEIRVKKVFGISMIQAIFYFKKENNVWVFKEKYLFGAIG
ncbi:MAG TPA: hypothetical protein VIV55_08100 [Flavobacterium sp.]